MKRNRAFFLLCLAYSGISNFFSCSNPQIGQPPPQAIYIRTFYKSTDGKDLLNSSTTNGFKKSDLKVTSKIEINGSIREVNYDDSGIDVYWDDALRMNYFGINIPTSYAKKPIETYVRLSQSLVDTVTYTFNSKQRQYIPDQIFYNKKLVWDVVNAPDDGLWPPITIVK